MVLVLPFSSTQDLVCIITFSEVAPVRTADDSVEEGRGGRPWTTDAGNEVLMTVGIQPLQDRMDTLLLWTNSAFKRLRYLRRGCELEEVGFEYRGQFLFRMMLRRYSRCSASMMIVSTKISRKSILVGRKDT